MSLAAKSEPPALANADVHCVSQVPSLLGEHASELYAKNQLNLLELMIKDKALKLDWEDEVIAKSCLTHAGEIKNEAAKKVQKSWTRLFAANHHRAPR